MIKFYCLRPLLFLLACPGCVAGGIAAAQEIKECTPAGAVLASAQGFVEEATGAVTAKIGNGPSCPVANSQTIVNDTIVATGDKSSAVLRFADGQGFSLPENSALQIVHYFFDEKDIAKSSAVFKLLKGGLHAVTGVIGQKNKEAFKLDAGGATIEIGSAPAATTGTGPR